MAAARTLWEECLALRRRAEAQLSVANVLLGLGWLTVHQLDYEEAVGSLHEALAIARDAAAPLLTTQAMIILGWADLLHDSPTTAAG
jgi:hypothetical protein